MHDNSCGAGGGGRTLMKLPSRDFESRASAIPPLRLINRLLYFNIIIIFFQEKINGFFKKFKNFYLQNYGSKKGILRQILII